MTYLISMAFFFLMGVILGYFFWKRNPNEATMLEKVAAKLKEMMKKK